MENVNEQKDLEQQIQNEPAEGKPNTPSGDLEYTDNEVEYADGQGTMLDEEIDDQQADDQDAE
jgi:hypothetical protein